MRATPTRARVAVVGGAGRTGDAGLARGAARSGRNGRHAGAELAAARAVSGATARASSAGGSAATSRTAAASRTAATGCRTATGRTATATGGATASSRQASAGGAHGWQANAQIAGVSAQTGPTLHAIRAAGGVARGLARTRGIATAEAIRRVAPGHDHLATPHQQRHANEHQTHRNVHAPPCRRRGHPWGRPDCRNSRTSVEGWLVACSVDDHDDAQAASRTAPPRPHPPRARHHRVARRAAEPAAHRAADRVARSTALDADGTGDRRATAAGARLTQ